MTFTNTTSSLNLPTSIEYNPDGHKKLVSSLDTAGHCFEDISKYRKICLTKFTPSC